MNIIKNIEERNNLRKQANKALLDNIKLLNAIANKINKGDINDAKQIVYLTFLENFSKYNKQRAALSNWIHTCIRLEACRKYDKSLNLIQMPDYVRTMKMLLYKGKMSTAPDAYNSFIKEHPNLKSITEDNFKRIITYLENEENKHKLFIDNTSELFTDEISELKEEKLFEPELHSEKQLMRSKLNRLLKCLTDREKNIVEETFGLNDGHEKTLEELGKMYCISKERVRQIKIKAIEKMYEYSQLSRSMLKGKETAAHFCN